MIRTYVQMLAPTELRQARRPGPDIRVEKVSPCPVDQYRMLYAEVGRRYHWVDRLVWSDADVENHLARREVSIWTMREGEKLAGYFELVWHLDGSVEIAYFGLLHEFLGRGLGKYLLTEATRRAWESGANRVWLHTCTLDHPAALPNYLARGFRQFKQETYLTEAQPALSRRPERREGEAKGRPTTDDRSLQAGTT